MDELKINDCAKNIRKVVDIISGKVFIDHNTCSYCGGEMRDAIVSDYTDLPLPKCRSCFKVQEGVK